MTSHTFQGHAYRTKDAMLEAIAEEWMTGGGMNSLSMCRALLELNGDDELAAEAISGFELDFIEEEGDGLSHMQRNDYDAHDLAEGFTAFRRRYTRTGSGW